MEEVVQMLAGLKYKNKDKDFVSVYKLINNLVFLREYNIYYILHSTNSKVVSALHQINTKMNCKMMNSLKEET